MSWALPSLIAKRYAGFPSWGWARAAPRGAHEWGVGVIGGSFTGWRAHIPGAWGQKSSRLFIFWRRFALTRTNRAMLEMDPGLNMTVTHGGFCRSLRGISRSVSSAPASDCDPSHGASVGFSTCAVTLTFKDAGSGAFLILNFPCSVCMCWALLVSHLSWCLLEPTAVACGNLGRFCCADSASETRCCEARSTVPLSAPRCPRLAWGSVSFLLL